MKIVDYRKEIIFKNECRKLAASILKSEKHFDLIVGIATGGEKIASFIKDEIPHSNYLIVQRKRSTTKFKEHYKISRIFIGFLPYSLQNFLRKIEWLIRETIFSINPSRKQSEVIVLDYKKISEDNKNILIIDDSIDSGNTILDVIDFLKKNYNPHTIKVASIIISFKSPLIKPDFFLLHRVAAKWPWSLDK